MKIPFTRAQWLRYSNYFFRQVYMPYARLSYLAILFFLVFAFSDLLFFDDNAFWPVTYRIILGSAMLAINYYIKQCYPRLLQACEVTLLLWSSLFLVYITTFAFEINGTNYQDGSILILIYIGTFSRLSIGYSIAGLTGALAIYLVGISPTMYAMDPIQETEHITMYFATYLLCLISCIRREYEYYNQFTQAKQIRSQKFVLATQSAELKKAALTDPLTELNNRLYLQQIVKPSIKQEQPIAVMMIDIDYFKAVNDQLGHLNGDKILQKLSLLLKNNLRNQGDIVRFGGEEFLIICQDMSQDKAELLAETLLCSARTVNVNNRFISISIGTYYTKSLSLSLSDAIQKADEALYLSKNNGRDRITYYQPTMTTKHLDYIL